ncbi:MAG TPA: GAF domain-containing protein, partial [Actinomycetes bacterium]|nr:GAF domain-containing protein [Actinomycetes bacterium]
MSTDSFWPALVRSPHGWTPEVRQEAVNQMEARLDDLTDTVEIAEAGAEYLCTLLKARTVTIIALRHGKYFDIVNVGYVPPDSFRYPSSRGYPTWEYPLATKELGAFGAYFTKDPSDPRFVEYVRVWDDPGVTSIMGVGIVADGELHGEIFHTGDRTRPPF